MIRRLLLIAAIVLLGMVGVLAAGGWFLLDTGAGLRMVLDVVQRNSGGLLSFGVAQGRLYDELLIEDLRYAGKDGTIVELHKLHLRLHARELWANRLHLDLLDAGSVRVQLAPPPAQPPPPAPVSLPARLPVDLLIDGLTVGSFELDGTGKNGTAVTQLQITRISLVGSWEGDQITVKQLGAGLAQTGALNATAQLTMATDHIDIAALELKGPGQVDASGTLGFDRHPNDLVLHWKDLNWPLLGNGDVPLVAGAQGQAHLTGSLDNYHIDTQTAATVHKVAVRLGLRGDGDLDKLKIAQLELHEDQGGGSLRAHGGVAWDPAVKADLEVQFDKLNPALLAADWSGTLNGTASTHTSVEKDRTDIAFKLGIGDSVLRGHPLSLTATGDTDLRKVDFAQLKLLSGKGSVDGNGSVAWSPQLAVNAQLQITSLDPGQFAAGWNGNLNGSLSARTSMLDGKPDIAFSADLSNSTLRSYPLGLSAHGDLRGETVVVKDLLLSSGDSKLSASGQATPPFDLKGQLDSPNLSQLHPDLAGQLGLQFQVQGALDTPHVVAKMQGRSVRYKQYRAGAVDLDADVDPQQESHLNLSATDANAGLVVHKASLSLTGKETWHHLRVDVDSERGQAGLAMDGGYDRRKREWGGQVGPLHLAPEKLPEWNSDKVSGLLLGGKRQSLEPLCLAGGSGRLCLSVEDNVTRTGLRLSWTLDRLDLASLKPMLPTGYAVEGDLEGSGGAEYANGDFKALDALLKLDNAKVQAPNAEALQVLPSTLKLDDEGGTLHAQLELKMPQGSVNADVNATPASSFDSRPLAGNVNVALPDLAFISSLTPELQAVGGHAEGQLRLGGTIGLPQLQGQVAVVDGHAKLVTPDIELKDVQLKLSGNGSGPLSLDGTMKSGDGSLSLSGNVDPSVTPLRADVQLKGDSFQAMASPDAHVWITPDLHLLADNSGVHLDGSLTVPKADITPHNLGDQGVSTSHDQVIVGAPPVPPSAVKVFSTLQVILGDSVRFEGFGLSSRLTGAVTINEVPQQDTTAQGEMRLVEGRYKAYGQDLSIETGRLIFTGGPVARPAVDISATRTPETGITVGVRVRGTLDKPELLLQSDPTMPREQILSWLVLGHPLDQASSSDRSMLSEAAISLGLSGGGYFVNQIGKKIGIDEISVGAAPAGDSSVTANAAQIQGSQAALNAGLTSSYTTQAAQLTLGKYLTPKLFVSYGVSLFEPGQTFRMLYDLGHGFKLQTESGVASGGDLLYTFERGK